ncbi:MAG: nucleotide disphospho-sugar-binding domain-containing protein [Thauera sp.]|jgi:UDP:flavonoid glycosyltransferase YjiC (YdhE family)
MTEPTANRLLFFAEGSTLAHVGRPLVLARALDAAGFEVVFARPPAYAWMTRDERFETVDLATQSPAEFTRRLDHGKPLYALGTLERYVQDDLALLRAHRPDVVIGDFRLSLSVSARLCGIPYATLCDAYWSPEAALEPALPVFPWTPLAPLAIAEPIFRRIAPFAFRLHARPMEALRRAHGLPGLGHDLRRCYTDADLRLFANPPALFPDVVPHAGAGFIGPLAWSPTAMAMPGLGDHGRPLVYVTMGSSGATNVLGTVLAALADHDCEIVVTTAGRPLPATVDRSRFRVFDYLPGELVCARASLVVCNGGSPTTNQALVHGAPVLGIARNMDQFLNMRAIERFGAGLTLRSDRVTPGALGRALARLLETPTPRQRANLLRDADPADPAARMRALGTHAHALLQPLFQRACPPTQSRHRLD